MRSENSPEKILIESVKKKHPVFLWYIFNDHVIKAELRVTAVRLEKGQLLFQVLPDSMVYAEQMVSGTGKMNFMIPEHSFLFSSELKSMEKDGILTVGMPEQSMFFERRQGGERISPDIPIRVRFTSRGEERIQICNDISEGGLSMVFTKSAKSRLKEGDEVHQLELTYGGQSFTIEAQVAKVLPLTPFMLESHPYAGERVSFRFKEVNEKALMHIRRIIEGHKKFLNDLLGR